MSLVSTRNMFPSVLLDTVFPRPTSFGLIGKLYGLMLFINSISYDGCSVGELGDYRYFYQRFPCQASECD